MTNSASHWRHDEAEYSGSQFSGSQYSNTGYHDDVASAELQPGEPITLPPQRRGRGSVILSSLIALSAAGGVWSLFANPPQWLQTLSDVYEDFSAAMQRADEPAKPAAHLQPADGASSDVPTVRADAGEHAVRFGPPAPDPAMLAAKDVSDAPGVNAGTAVANDLKAPSGDVASDTLDTAPLAQAQPPPPRLISDPYQKKAEAVGLNPDVSRALLKKLSKADYRNAGIAIKTALAETADSDVFNWPREKKAGLAQFEVKFVTGAEEKCRRYVVTITKDRWSTTAPPMEKCGISTPQANARKVSIDSLPDTRAQKKPRLPAGPSDVNG
jgi:hypothetical protein